MTIRLGPEREALTHEFRLWSWLVLRLALGAYRQGHGMRRAKVQARLNLQLLEYWRTGKAVTLPRIKPPLEKTFRKVEHGCTPCGILLKPSSNHRTLQLCDGCEEYFSVVVGFSAKELVKRFPVTPQLLLPLNFSGLV